MIATLLFIIGWLVCSRIAFSNFISDYKNNFGEVDGGAVGLAMSLSVFGPLSLIASIIILSANKVSDDGHNIKFLQDIADKINNGKG